MTAIAEKCFIGTGHARYSNRSADYFTSANSCNAFPQTLQVRPKLHVTLVLEKWAWHIRALLEICYNLA